MAEFNLGQVAFNDRGAHSGTETYSMWDFATTVDSTYLYVNTEPSIGKSVTDTTYWRCIADGKQATEAARLSAIATALANAAAQNADTARDGIQADLGSKSGAAEEKTTAQALSELNAKIKALEAVVTNNTVERLVVANEFDLYGKTNLILSGEGAPAMTPDFIGQSYIDTTGKVVYTATGVTNAGDWKQ